MSSDTPQVVCLHDFALPTPRQPPEQVKRYRSSTHVPVIFGSPARWIVIAAEPITDVDTTAGAMLEDLDVTLNESGISLVFAELKDPVRHRVNRYELSGEIDPAHFFPTLHAAVTAYRAETGAQWSRTEREDTN